MPSTKSCIVETEAEPPSSVTDLSVTSVEIESWGGKGLMVNFDLSWSPPLITNGELVEYEVNVTTADDEILHHSTYPVSVKMTTVPVLIGCMHIHTVCNVNGSCALCITQVGQLSSEVNITISSNVSSHCLYAMVSHSQESFAKNCTQCSILQIRSSNGYAWSDWSDPVIIPLDQGCQTTPTTSQDDESECIQQS